MKKIIVLSYVFILLIVALVGTTYSSPESTILKEVTNSTNLQNVVDLIDLNEYGKAMNTLEQINGLDQQLVGYNKNKFNLLLSEYKKILISEAQKLSDENNNTFALNLLNSKLKYYKNDESINALIAYNENIIKSKNLVEYTGEIEHLFTHCLLAFPEQALNPKNSMSKDYDRDCLTPTEFKRILSSLYNNNYVLIDIDSIYEVKNGITVKKKLMLPQGKKPLIFSFDDVNYDSKKKNKGMVDKIILDRNNQIATYTSKQSIAKRVSYDNEFVTIMEAFIKNHPDFSFNGARGVINLTGYDGILGYRTQKSNATNRYEIKKATEVVTKLKNLGWKFASHSYGHYHMKNITDMEFAKEVQNWQNEVAPIIGETAIYVYPYGEWEVKTDNNELSYKHKLLLDAGFKLFLGVGGKNFFGYVPIGSGENHTLLMDRKSIDGRTLRSNKVQYSHLFNCEEVYDNINRTIPFNQE